MATFEVEIPCWSDGCPLTITGIEAMHDDHALEIVVDWVNRRAGYHYCNRLPPGTKVFGPGGLAQVVPRWYTPPLPGIFPAPAG
jgi:hypothetical protein